MSAPRKRWDEHSDRWKREKTRQGLDKRRWDNWFKLSAKSRKVADPYKYAKGESVREQRVNQLRSAAFRHMTSTFPQGRAATIRLGLEEMTNAQLRWTAKATASQLAGKARVKYVTARNPWWYR